MRVARIYSTLQRGLTCATLGALLATAARAQNQATTTPPPSTSPLDRLANAAASWDLPDFIAQLPETLAEQLPGFDPEGAVRLYVRPHFGDFIHRDYVRVPVGARIKVSERIETSAEVESYFTHGLGDAAGYGLSHLQLGAKCEHVLTGKDGSGLSVGANFLTPLSRPPMDLTDGYRHFSPYVAGTMPLMTDTRWHVLGFATISGDFLNHTALPSNFAKNQLHENSTTLSVGAAREWRQFHTSLTASVTTSALTSDEHQQVYGLRPEIVFPWKPRAYSRSNVLFTLDGRAIHGPDGNDFGVSGSVRVEFSLNRARSEK